MTKSPEQHLLKTKLTDLTDQIKDQLVKEIGTSESPFPMWGSERDDSSGHADLEQLLSAVSSDKKPLKIYSERPFEEVITLAYSDMPVPSMLALFQDGLERRLPESKNRTQFMIGDPGFGKSFLGAHQGRMRSKERVEVYDCGGKNMNELLFEMVLDFGAADALPKAIDKRLAATVAGTAGGLQDVSIGLLKTLPGGVVSTDADGEIQSIDWGHFKSGAADGEVEGAFEILKKVSQMEGLENAGGNALGMNSQFGRLIQWFIEGREGVLDEYNKSREGTDNALQSVWQFFNGEINECTVENPLKNKDTNAGPASFTFKREDMKVGFFVTLTGNKTEDGITTRSLNKSVYSRLSPQTLPDPNEADWQHRICQMMVGIPVSTLHTIYKDQDGYTDAGFGAWLLELREQKAKIEGVPVPELQEALLQNWQSVVRSSEKLAKFYNTWTELTDVEKIISAGSPELMEEVDEEYTKKEGIDFRKIKQHLEEAVPIRPHMVPRGTTLTINFANFFKRPKLKEEEPESQALFFGSRLVEYLERLVYEKTAAVGKPKLYEKLKAAMDNAGLRDVALIEGAHSQSQKSVEEDLNISSFASNDATKQAEHARKVFCDYLREIDANVTEKDDDKIITIDKLRRAIKAVKNEDTAETKQVFFVNSDLETALQSPIETARIEDIAVRVAEGRRDEPLNFTLTELVKHEDFMAALALPVVSNKNIDALWDTNVRPLSDSESGDPDEALDMAENKSDKGIGTTTLRVLFQDAANNGEPRDVSVHIVYNNARNKALVVGEAVPSKLQAAFREAGITHVDRQDRDARTKIDAALNDLTRGMPESVKDHLTDAFKYRNDVDTENHDSLAELMVNPEVDMLFAKYLIKAPKKLGLSK